MEVSRGTAYGMGLSQCAITLGVILFFPSVRVDLFIANVHVNGTAITSFVQTMETHLALPVLAASGLAAIFTTLTCKSYENGIAGQDFNQENLDQLGMWDLLFWAFCTLAHGIVVVMVADPVDLYGCVSSTTFMVYFLYRACSPKGQHANLTMENLNILGYCLGILQLTYQITDTRENGATIVMILVVLDYFLGIGHTYDRHTTIDTVANCRLFYICMGSLSLACFYSMYNISDARNDKTAVS
jgi:hypothetical protein